MAERAEGGASVLAFFRGPVARRVLPLLLLIDMPQNVGIALVGPFLIDLHLTPAQVGLVSGTAGLLSALAGAVLAGALLTQLSRVRALVIVGTLQAIPLFGFAAMASLQAGGLPTALLVVCTAYGFASAFNVALSSWFMDLVSPRQPATDYSIMACVHTGTFAVAGPIAGWCAQRFGYAPYYLVSGALALVLLAVGYRWLRRPLELGSPGAVAAAAGDPA
jgi:PAT family beta-lactamase induction signal transducer AmpG